MTTLAHTVFRVRLLIFIAGLIAGVAGVLLRALGPESWQSTASALHLGFFGILVALLLAVAGRWLAPVGRSRTVAAPVRGRWMAINSPATKVPSHGIRSYGQAYAVDLVYEPAEATRPEFGSGPAFGRNEDYPAFGEPVYAMIDGTVVAASGWRRDHRSRGRLPAVFYMLAEGAIRELGGPGFIVGNHVTIRGADGEYALVAHLRRGSLKVSTGDRVRAGDVLAACGNSGNSSEPHVHAQIMDRRNLLLAQGVPMEFADVAIEDGVAEEPPVLASGMPANEQRLITR